MSGFKLSRSKYDCSKINNDNKISMDPFEYFTYKGQSINNNKCLGQLPHDKISSVSPDCIDSESQLHGLKKDMKNVSIKNKTIKICRNNNDYTRLSNPLLTSRGIGYNRFSFIN